MKSPALATEQLAQAGEPGACRRWQLPAKPVEPGQYTFPHGRDLPEVHEPIKLAAARKRRR